MCQWHSPSTWIKEETCADFLRCFSSVWRWNSQHYKLLLFNVSLCLFMLTSFLCFCPQHQQLYGRFNGWWWERQGKKVLSEVCIYAGLQSCVHCAYIVQLVTVLSAFQHNFNLCGFAVDLSGMWNTWACMRQAWRYIVTLAVTHQNNLFLKTHIEHPNLQFAS